MTSIRTVLGSSIVAVLALAGTGSARAAERPEVPFQGPPVTIRSFTLPEVACRPSKPIMPEQARLLDITGTVLVEYTVHADGHVGEISLAKSTAHPVLAEAVRNWLDGCSFTPPSKADGQRMTLRLAQPYIFRQP
jgi:TonB family protein